MCQNVRRQPVYCLLTGKWTWRCKKRSSSRKKRPFCSSNWLDWKIQWEIMRSDMSKCCWRWKAWGHQECFKMCSRASRLNEAYFHGNHTKSNLSGFPLPTSSLLDIWPWLVLRQTTQLYTVLSLQLRRGHHSFSPTEPVFRYPSLFTLCCCWGGCIIPHDIVYFPMWHRWNESFEIQKTWITFSFWSEQSCLILK